MFDTKVAADVLGDQRGVLGQPPRSLDGVEWAMEPRAHDAVTFLVCLLMSKSHSKRFRTTDYSVQPRFKFRERA